jgi:SAM-dependent methyltransferase
MRTDIRPDSQSIIREAFEPIADIYETLALVLQEDVPFWVNLCSGTRGDVLELGCGTGRITLELARAGSSVVGLDLSDKMLEVAEKNLSREGPDVRSRVRFVKGDMTDFRFEERFNAVILPFFTLAVLPTRESQKRCIRCVKSALAPGGFFAFDLSGLIQIDPRSYRWTPYEVTRIRDVSSRYHWRGEMYRDVEGVLYMRSHFRFKDGKGEGDRRTWTIRLLPTTERDVEELLSGCGLALSKKIANYGDTAHEHGQKTALYIARHA